MDRIGRDSVWEGAGAAGASVDHGARVEREGVCAPRMQCAKVCEGVRRGVRTSQCDSAKNGEQKSSHASYRVSSGRKESQGTPSRQKPQALQEHHEQ